MRACCVCVAVVARGSIAACVACSSPRHPCPPLPAAPAAAQVHHRLLHRLQPRGGGGGGGARQGDLQDVRGWLRARQRRWAPPVRLALPASATPCRTASCQFRQVPRSHHPDGHERRCCRRCRRRAGVCQRLNSTASRKLLYTPDDKSCPVGEYLYKGTIQGGCGAVRARRNPHTQNNGCSKLARG